MRTESNKPFHAELQQMVEAANSKFRSQRAAERRSLLEWTHHAHGAEFYERYQAVCVKLFDIFTEEGELPPMFVFQRAGMLSAFKIDETGMAEPIDRQILWLPNYVDADVDDE